MKQPNQNVRRPPPSSYHLKQRGFPPTSLRTKSSVFSIAIILVLSSASKSRKNENRILGQVISLSHAMWLIKTKHSSVLWHQMTAWPYSLLLFPKSICVLCNRKRYKRSKQASQLKPWKYRLLTLNPLSSHNISNFPTKYTPYRHKLTNYKHVWFKLHSLKTMSPVQRRRTRFIPPRLHFRTNIQLPCSPFTTEITVVVTPHKRNKQPRPNSDSDDPV